MVVKILLFPFFHEPELTLHRVRTPSSRLILQMALKTWEQFRRWATGNLRPDKHTTSCQWHRGINTQLFTSTHSQGAVSCYTTQSGRQYILVTVPDSGTYGICRTLTNHNRQQGSQNSFKQNQNIDHKSLLYICR